MKRSADTRIRREVVGQMLDYAANAVLYWSIEDIKNSYERYCEKNQVDPYINLQELLGEDKSVNEFWEKVNINLKAGKIRLIFVADKIPKELQRIIEFLNEQMNPAEVLGLEIKQFGNDNLKTLVPKIIGQTSSAQIKKRYREKTQWTEESFYKELERREGRLSVEIVKKLINNLRSKVSRFWFGQGKQMGSIVPTIDLPSTSYYLFAIWTYGKIAIYFQWYKEKPPFDDIKKRLELLEKLNTIKGVNIPESKIDKRPSFPIQLLKEQEEFEKFINIYEWFLEEVKAYN